MSWKLPETLSGGSCFFFKNVPTSSHHSEMFRQHHQQTHKHTAADLLEGWSFSHKLCSVSFTCALADASPSAWNILPLSCHLQSTIKPLREFPCQTKPNFLSDSGIAQERQGWKVWPDPGGLADTTLPYGQRVSARSATAGKGTQVLSVQRAMSLTS